MHYANEAEEKLENIKCDIRHCREQIETIRSTLTRTNIKLSHDRIQSSPNLNRTLDGIIRIMEFENELSRLIREGTEFISQLDSEQMQKVCILFYIRQLNICDIARKMKYSKRHIYRLLHDATVQLSKQD